MRPTEMNCTFNDLSDNSNPDSLSGQVLKIRMPYIAIRNQSNIDRIKI